MDDNNCRKLNAFVGIVLFSFSCALAAQALTSDEVRVTASRVEKDLSDVSMSVAVITHEDIRHSHAKNVGDLLRDIPGVRISGDGGQGMKRILIRGESPSRTLILIDGQKIAEQKTMHGAPILIDIGRIERIEVIKGTASVLYGSDAIGGAVNIITKKESGKAFEGEAGAGFDSSSEGKSAHFSLGGNLNGWDLRLSAAADDNKDLKTPEGEMWNTYFKSESASAFAAYRFNEKLRAGASLDYYDIEYGSSDPSWEGFRVDIPSWKRSKAGIFAEARALTEKLENLRADFFYQKSKKEMENPMPMGPGMGLNLMTDNSLEQYGFSLQSDWALNEFNYLVAGYEFGYEKLDAESNNIWRNPHTETLQKSESYDGSQMNHAVYAGMETELMESLTLNYGMRYTYVESDMDILNRMNGKKKSGDSSDGKAVFNIGAVWKLDGKTSIRANFTQGYRMPLLQELYVDTSMGSRSGISLANPDLKPETSDSFELGFRRYGDRLTADAAFFYTESDDYIGMVPVAGTENKQFVNIAKSKAYGAELTASCKMPGTGFEPYAELTLMRRQNDDGVGFKTYDTATPAFSARYGIRWSGERSGMNVRTDFFARSQSSTDYESKDGETDYSLAGFTTLNLTAGIDFGEDDAYSLDIGLYNLLDKEYRYEKSIAEAQRHIAVKLSGRF